MAFLWDLQPARTADRRAERCYDPELEFYFGRGDARAAIGQERKKNVVKEVTASDGRMEDDDPRQAVIGRRKSLPLQARTPTTQPAPELGSETWQSGYRREAPRAASGRKTAVGNGGDAATGEGTAGRQRPQSAAATEATSARRAESAAARGGRPSEETVGRRRRRPEAARSLQASPSASTANRSNTWSSVGELSARRIRDMIPEELRAVCKAHSLPPTGSTSEMRGRLMALLPTRKASAGAVRSVVDSSNPGYRPSRQHLAAADSAHARGANGAGASGAAALTAARVRLVRPIAIAQLSLQDIRHRASTSLDFLRGGKIAVLLFWATGVGGGVDPNAKKWSGSAIPHDP